MIGSEELRLAGDHLRAAWHNYVYVFSRLQNYHTQGTAPTYSISPELGRQLDTELTFISSYEPKIQEIKSYINRACNYSSLAPINLLPPEILSRIFHQALSQPCDTSPLRLGKKTSYHRHLDHLTEVCHLWRRTAISTCSLWSHIDLSPSKRVCDRLIARAKLHVARAGVLPFQLHVEENEYFNLITAFRSYHDGLHTFLSPIYRRVQTLELATDAFESFHRTLFRKLFLYEDSTVTKLVVRSNYSCNESFIVATGRYFGDHDTGEEVQELELDLTESQLERGLARLTTLHLRDMFPSWSSTAYRGLVDLRLLSIYRRVFVSQAQFITILNSSPGLRILHFGLTVQVLTPDTVEAVHLPELQVVKIFPEAGEVRNMCPSILLRLLAPGTKPLRLSIDGYYESSTILLTELEHFFSRSKVARFYSRAITPPMRVLLRHAADLELVIFHDFNPIPSTWLEADELGSLPPLRLLYMFKSILHVEELHSLLKYCPNGIVLDSCDVERDASESWLSPAELLNTFPAVTVINTPLCAPDPTEDWDYLD